MLQANVSSEAITQSLRDQSIIRPPEQQPAQRVRPPAPLAAPPAPDRMQQLYHFYQQDLQTRNIPPSLAENDVKHLIQQMIRAQQPDDVILLHLQEMVTPVAPPSEQEVKQREEAHRLRRQQDLEFAEAERLYAQAQREEKEKADIQKAEEESVELGLEQLQARRKQGEEEQSQLRAAQQASERTFEEERKRARQEAAARLAEKLKKK